MNKYAQVRGGIVQSTFYSKLSFDEVKRAFPDIAPYLFEVADEVRDNWGFDPEDGFFDPVAVADQPDSKWYDWFLKLFPR